MPPRPLHGKPHHYLLLTATPRPPGRLARMDASAHMHGSAQALSPSMPLLVLITIIAPCLSFMRYILTPEWPNKGISYEVGLYDRQFFFYFYFYTRHPRLGVIHDLATILLFVSMTPIEKARSVSYVHTSTVCKTMSLALAFPFFEWTSLWYSCRFKTYIGAATLF